MTIIWKLSVNNDLYFGVSRKKENDMAFTDTRLCKCWQFSCLEWTLITTPAHSKHTRQLSCLHTFQMFSDHDPRASVFTPLLTASVYPFKSSPWEHDLITLYDTLKGHGNIYRMDFQSARRGWLSWVIWITKASMHGSNPCTDGNAARTPNPIH